MPRTDNPSNQRKVWLGWTVFFAALLLLGGAAYYVICVPPSHAVPFKVTFARKGYETNAIGTVTPLFLVTNAGAEKVDVWGGTEFGVNAIDFGWSPPTTLEPGEQRVLPIRPTIFYPQSRPVLQCYRFYSRDLRGRAERWFDTYLMKRIVTERIYPGESAN